MLQPVEKMKKFLITIWPIVYITASCGATIHLHYCMGKLESWGLSAKHDAKCSACGMHKTGHKGCCRDEQKLVKIEKDQKISESAFQFLIISSDAATISSPICSIIFSSSIVIKDQTAHAPPRSGVVPVFILNCNFRI